jgi:hypothetical protein
MIKRSILRLSGHLILQRTGKEWLNFSPEGMILNVIMLQQGIDRHMGYGLWESF